MSLTKRVLLYVMALMYIAAGVMHFLRPNFYVNIMPPYLPWHLELVYLSGVRRSVRCRLRSAHARGGSWATIAL